MKKKKYEDLTDHEKFLVRCGEMQHPEYWKFPFGINEGDDYGKYEYKMPMSIKKLTEIAEKFEDSRDFGLSGIEDLYGIRGKSGNIEYWFTVRRGSYERINWLSQDKCGEFIVMAMMDEFEKEKK